MYKEIKVNSSAIDNVGYDDIKKMLKIEFHGGRIYEYENVPKQEFLNIVAAPSVGKYYNAHIKGVF